MTHPIPPTFQLPDNAVQLIHQIAVDDDLPQFAIGDLAVELVDEFCQRGDIPKHVVRAAIAKEYGSGAETIRDRERVSRLVPAALRAAYPILRFHQWRAICGAADKGGIAQYAEQAVSAADNQGGRPWTVAQIRRELRRKGLPGWRARLGRVVELLERVIDDPLLPSDARAGIEGDIVRYKALLE